MFPFPATLNHILLQTLSLNIAGYAGAAVLSPY